MRSNGDGQIAGQINSDVASAGFEHRIGSIGGRQELGNDSASSRFRACGRDSVQFNTAPAGFGFHGALGGTQADASAARLHYYGPADVAEVQAAATRCGVHRSLTTFHLNISTTGFQSPSPQTGSNPHASTP